MADQDFRERVLEALSRLESQARENNARLEKRLDSLDTRVGTLERDVGWIKGKLEGKQEGRSKVLTVLTVCTAVGAAIIRFRCQNPILQVWDVDTALVN